MMEFNPNQFANPTGEEGERLTKYMNDHHLLLTMWGLDNINITPTDEVLDIGCGGGNTVKIIGKVAKSVKAVDISQVCCDSTIKNNQDLIDSGKLEVIKANVASLPFSDNRFDVITAVETVYFWQDILVSFRQVYRTLAYGGTFCMIFETYACPEQHEYNMELKSKIDGFNVYSPEQLEIYLTDVGFREIIAVMHPTKPWLCCIATK